MVSFPFRSGVAASLVALAAVGGGAAYAPPAGLARARARSRVGVLGATAASDLDGVGDGGSSDEVGATSASKTSKPASPLGPSPLPYIRIQKRGRHYDVQTAVTTFRRTGGDVVAGRADKATVDLHAQIHFGDASYFDYFNDDDNFGNRYDKVLYELIVEDRFLAPSDGAPHLKRLLPHEPGSTLNPIAPTQADRSTASQYGLQCQVDTIRYCREGWVHADLTREEFLGHLQREEKTEKTTAAEDGRDNQQPLWALASTAATYPGSELVTSLMRPLTTTSNSASAALTRRLFTHLFLPGDALSGWIRTALWLGVPSPELSVMLVDWSSLSYLTQRSRRRGARGEEGRVGPISPIAAPVFLSLLTGNWGTARRLVFGQVLVGGQSNADDSRGGVLIDKRNERALDVLRDALDAPAEGGGAERRVALLYGAGHCRDLHLRLAQEGGLTPVRTEWRTAFRATAPRWGDFVDAGDLRTWTGDVASGLPPAVGDGEGMVRSLSASTLESVAVGLVVLPLYLLVGGLDWVSTVADVGNALDQGAYVDGVAAALLYLVRHLALYVGISKFVVDWGGNSGVFEDDGRA